MHQEAMAKLAAKSSAVHVRSQLSKQHEAEMRNHRAMFMKLLDCVRYLARQDLPLRGHHEDSLTFDGNLLQLLLLQAKDDCHVVSWLKKRDYLSPEIINEIISLREQKLLRQLLQEISEANFLALIVDEAIDVSHNEQTCIAIRWVDSRYTIHKDAIGLIQLPDTKSVTLFSTIKYMLILCSLPLSNCIGQSYDGPDNMSAVRNGVEALLKKEEDGHCLCVHCFAHSLNLCIKMSLRSANCYAIAWTLFSS